MSIPTIFPKANAHLIKLYDIDVIILPVIIYPSSTGLLKLSSHPTILAKSFSDNPSSKISSLLIPAMNGFPLSNPVLTSNRGAIEIAPIVFPSNFLMKSIILSFSILSLISIAPGNIKLSYASKSILSIVSSGNTDNPSSLLIACFAIPKTVIGFSASANISSAGLISKLQKVFFCYYRLAKGIPGILSYAKEGIRLWFRTKHSAYRQLRLKLAV